MAERSGDGISAVVRSHFDEFCSAIADANPSLVSRKLFEGRLISRAMHDTTETSGLSRMDQASRLMNAMMAALSIDDEGKTLNAFLVVLRSCGNACAKLADAVLEKLTGVVHVQASPTPSIGITERLHEASILEVLHRGSFSNPDWKRLGSALGLSPAQLDTIAADTKANNTAGLSNALIDMLSNWLRQDLHSSWEKLAQALEKLCENKLAVIVRNQKEDLTVNSIHDVLTENDFIESRWEELGTNLGLSAPRLQGIAATHLGNLPGAQSNALIHTLSSWLRHDVNASWDTLAKALKKIGYPKIAAKICP